MARKLPRWALVGGILAGAAALATAAVVAVRRLFGGGYDERPLGEPIAYPAAGAGTGFPEPTSPEHTETIDEGVVPELRGPAIPPGEEPTNTAVGEVVIIETATLPEEETTPHIAAGDETAGTAAVSPTSASASDRPAPPPAFDYEATRPMPPPGLDLNAARAPQPAAGSQPSVPITETPQPLSPDDTDPVAGTFTAVPSEPLQRPPVPLTEEQAEVSARMQVHQQQLYAAFPGLTPGDIVASDGVVERLAQSAAERTGMSLDDARARLHAILNTGPDQKADEGIEPDLAEPKE